MSDPGNNPGGLKTGITLAAITGLLIGGVAAFGVFSRVIEMPLQQENDKLKADLLRVELERSEHAQTIPDYEQQIETLQNQLAAMEADNAETVQELRLELDKINLQYESTLKSLQRERRRNRQAGDGWSGKYQ